jgi:hypothetical protein
MYPNDGSSVIHVKPLFLQLPPTSGTLVRAQRRQRKHGEPGRQHRVDHGREEYQQCGQDADRPFNLVAQDVLASRYGCQLSLGVRAARSRLVAPSYGVPTDRLSRPRRCTRM